MPNTPEIVSSQENPNPDVRCEQFDTFRTRSGEKSIGYDVTIDDKHFARYYQNPDGSTLAWPGRFDFSQIDKTAMAWFAIATHDTSPDIQLDDIKDSLRISMLTNDKGLVQLNLNDPNQLQNYQRQINSLQSVTFIRYDLTTPSGRFTLAAQNPLFLETQQENPELGVALPWPEAFSGETMEWVVQHHESSLLHSVNPQTIAEFLPYGPPDKSEK